MITTHKHTIIDVDSDKWLIFYNDETKELLTRPFQAGGSYTCADTLVTADSLEECNAFIIENHLVDRSANSDGVIDS